MSENFYDFEFKAFDEMTPEDFARVGFKSGLEVHQQLLTDRKLFCRCPAGKYTHEYDAEILRHMRPTLSELGEYDGTALMEFKTKKNIIYRIHHESVCTYEMDDTPPFMINDQALDIALEIGLLQDSTIVDELHIARKQYLDGSIPTGFQRTAIVSVGGRIPYKDRYINMIQMSIEEDSCREESDIGHDRIYITDRLGMPLIETVTHPEMKTPVEVAEVCEIIRRLSRSTGKVRTGIGAGREDVNVSVEGGTRVEIKGVPRIKEIPLLTYNEAMRQWNLLRLREELKRREITEETFEAYFRDVTKILRKTKFQPIHDAIAEKKLANCVVLKGFKGLLNWQTQTDTYFSKEISDRVRVIACLTRLPNIIHSDNPSETISTNEWNKIRKLVNAGDNDTLVLVWGGKEDVECGSNEIIIRAKEATEGIPSETRQANRDGTNGFERILPGPERMYPDTDLPPRRITKERFEEIASQMPERVWERENWYKVLELPHSIAYSLAVSKFADTFKRAVNDLDLPLLLAAYALIIYPKKLHKKGYDTGVLTPEVFEKVFEAYKHERIVKDGIYYALRNICLAGEYSKELFPTVANGSEVRKAYDSSLKELKKMKIRKQEMAPKLLTGLVMGYLRGRVDGAMVQNYIKDNFKARE